MQTDVAEAIRWRLGKSRAQAQVVLFEQLE
jgi:hypothetical protein